MTPSMVDATAPSANRSLIEEYTGQEYLAPRSSNDSRSGLREEWGRGLLSTIATRLHRSLLRDICGICHPCDHQPAPITAMFAFRRVAGAVLPDGAGMVDGCEAEGADDPVPRCYYVVPR